MEETSVLIAQAQAGDKEAREVLIEKNLGLVHHIVKRFMGRGYDLEDLFQIGTIGLMKAIDKFDLSFDVKFSTYAVPMITGEIKRFLRDDGMVKIGRTLKENGYKAKVARERLSQKLGREPSLQEVAIETGMAVEDVVMAFEAGNEVESIHKSMFQADGSEVTLEERLADPSGNKQEQLLNQMVIRQLIEELSSQEQQLILLRYYQDQTQTQVAKILGVSQVQVSRMEKKILLRMREKIS